MNAIQKTLKLEMKVYTNDHKCVAGACVTKKKTGQMFQTHIIRFFSHIYNMNFLGVFNTYIFGCMCYGYKIIQYLNKSVVFFKKQFTHSRRRPFFDAKHSEFGLRCWYPKGGIVVSCFILRFANRTFFRSSPLFHPSMSHGASSAYIVFSVKSQMIPRFRRPAVLSCQKVRQHSGHFQPLGFPSPPSAPWQWMALSHVADCLRHLAQWRTEHLVEDTEFEEVRWGWIRRLYFMQWPAKESCSQVCINCKRASSLE